MADRYSQCYPHTANPYLCAVLKTLRISNYAIINEAEISFSEKMNIITGETGAGKSILLGALGLVLGERATTGVLFNKDKKCVVEGVFDIGHYGLDDFFSEENIDYDAETIIRRELSDNGKSRAFINDTPVNLTVLQKLADKLVTVHSQHETLALGDSAFQLMVVDALAGTQDILSVYKEQYLNWKNISAQLAEAEAFAARSGAEKDFTEFQFRELENAELGSVDQAALENELSQLLHAEEIKKNLLQSAEILENGQGSIDDRLREVIAHLRNASKFSDAIEPFITRLTSVSIEIKDIARDLDIQSDAAIADPKRAELIQDKLSVLFRLQKKHNCTTVEALQELQDRLGEKLNAFVNSEETIERLKNEQSKAFVQLRLTAKKLSEKRVAQFSALETSVKALLTEVGMKDAVLKIEHVFDIEKNLQISGADHLQYLFSANKGSGLQDIKKVASGGELSRLMLCIKSLLAKSVALPTLIFDEIDTGVSGEVAHKVGNILVQLSENHQLIAITHLPQIAAKGNHHLYVYKETFGEATFTKLKVLNAKERHTEIAKMLSGENPTKAALENAGELLGMKR